MASNDSNYPPNSTDNMSRNRRSSVTSATLSSIFRSNSTSSANNGTPAFPGPITSAAMDQNRRRRLSVSTTAALGLSGATAGNGSASAGPNSGMGASSFAARRASMSTNSSTSDTAFDENAIEDDDAPAGSGSRNSPSTQFARRMSFGAQAMRNLRGPGGTSPGGASSNDQGYNWPEQLRSRAESSVASGARPSFSFASGMGNSPPRASGFGSMSGFASGGSSGIPGGAGGGVGTGGGVGLRHDRAKSVSDVPTPAPAQQRPAPQPRQPRPKPDHFQERILKGDFYMD